jgi:tetratricopeptide (TPR) repeat protein
MTDPLVGTTVAHYEVLGKLGGGGMGVVYTARNLRLGQIVALKFLPPQWSHDESAKQRFLREAQAASATNHRNICTIHDIETASDGQLFIVMAYYQGETLKQKLEGGALPVEEAVEIAAQIAEGLAKAHGEGIVHRDVKPGNLMLVDGDVKILDFGLAKFANSLQLTIEGSTLGTVAYMSPEQTRGEEADARSDVWSLGVVLFEMLAGTLPFKGAYPEAVSHAIRHDPVPAVRLAGAELPSQLRTMLERMLQKHPAARYPSARELARDLRLLQGRTIPLDLITAPIHAPALQLPPRRRWWQSRTAIAVAVVLAIVAVSAPVWLFAPVTRVPVVLLPLVNQTGYAELDAYRPALTAELISELFDSPAIRVLPYDRELEILARFRTAGQDISSREALQALVAQSGAQSVVVPALTYENGSWRARIEFRDASTATNAAVADTPPVVSSLIKDTAYGLMPAAATAIDNYFLAAGPRRASIAQRLRQAVGVAVPPPARRFRSLDAASAFERALDAFGQMEYASAVGAFAEAVKQDPRNPPLLGWQSLAAHIARRDGIATETAAQALRLLDDQTPTADRLFVEAVAAETRRDAATAEARYRARTDRYPDDAVAMMQLAGFQDRANRNADAITSYLAVLARDPRLARPNVELCRMYNRLNEFAKAREFAQKALSAYQAIGARNGEGQSLFCLADSLRGGSDADREVARGYAERAAQIFGEIGAQYNLARAHNYQALIAGTQGRRLDAAKYGEQALSAAQRAGNVVLQPLVLMNLGVTYESMGERARAADYYLQSSKLYESLGDEARAAQIQANRANLLINYGGNAEEVMRDAQNALTVARKFGDAKFEVTSLLIVAAAYQNAGRQDYAERELNRIISLAKERDLKDDLAEATVELARLRLKQGRYSEALDTLTQALGAGSDPVEPLALMVRGQILTRLGDFPGADMALTAAADSATRRGENSVLTALEMSRGELAYESGKLAEAGSYFRRAAARWTDSLPDPASVDARAYVGLLDALNGQLVRGTAALTESLEQARKMGHIALEARCRVLFARIYLKTGRADAALAMLREVREDAERAIGPELQAQVHYWRALALERRGDSAGAIGERRASRELLDKVRATIPDRYRRTFQTRFDVTLPET